MLRPTDNAFPVPDNGERGLNVREYFALQLMVAVGQGVSIPLDSTDREALDVAYGQMAAESVRMADALIVALNRR